MRQWLLALLLAGCQSHPADLRVATGDSGLGLEPHRRIIALFQERHPTLHVQLEAVSGGDYYTRLLTQLASGHPPDVVHLGDDAMARFVQRGCLRPLHPPEPSEYLPGVLEPGISEGQQLLMPKDFTPLAVYCNQRLFRQAGIALPQDDWSWEEFVELAGRLQKATGQWGAVLPGPRSSLLEYLVALEGGNWLEFEGSAQERAVARLQAALSSGACPYPAELASFMGSNQEFERGQAAMRLSGRWALPRLRQRPDLEVCLRSAPRGRRRANILYWSGLGVTQQSGKPQLAREYVELATGPRGSTIWSGWGLPAVSAVAEGFRQDPLERVFLEELKVLAPRTYQLEPTWGELGQAALVRLHESILLEPQAPPTLLLARQSQRLRQERRSRP